MCACTHKPVCLFWKEKPLWDANRAAPCISHVSPIVFSFPLPFTASPPHSLPFSQAFNEKRPFCALVLYLGVSPQQQCDFKVAGRSYGLTELSSLAVPACVVPCGGPARRSPSVHVGTGHVAPSGAVAGTGLHRAEGAGRPPGSAEFRSHADRGGVCRRRARMQLHAPALASMPGQLPSPCPVSGGHQEGQPAVQGTAPGSPAVTSCGPWQVPWPHY